MSIPTPELHLYDYTDNWLRRMGYAEEYCSDYRVTTGACYRNRPGRLHAGVASIHDVSAWIGLIGMRELSIGSLIFHTHGAPGYVHLPNGGITAANVGTLHAACSRYLVGGAFVGFMGCNVAEGARGEAFLLAAARQMLGRVGGTAFATDSVTFAVPYLGQRSPLWSDAAVATIAAGGAPAFRRFD
jgi:hypothetical protein